MSLGDRSQLEQNSRMQGTITISDDCVMGPDVVMMATSHEFADITPPSISRAQNRRRRLSSVTIVGSARVSSFCPVFTWVTNALSGQVLS